MIRRSALAVAHRWLGLALAVFLLPVCVTGSVLTWKAPLDRWLNPQLFRAPPHEGAVLDEARLRAALAAVAPSARIQWVESPTEPGASAIASVARWPDPRPDHRINEVFLDPYTGRVLGARSTATPTLTRAELLPWLRRFHYTLSMQRTGMVLMGAVAIAWLFDSLLGTVLTVPRGIERWRRWLQAWRVRGARMSFDLHRASSLWLWPMLVVLAMTSIYLNLAREVFVPAVEAMARVLPRQWRDDVISTVLEWQEPLHTGEAFGVAGRLLVCLTGLGAAAGITAGLLSWLRTPRRKAAGGRA